MTTDKPSPLLPRLRFPEFRDDSTWLALQLADLYGFKRTNTLSRDKLNYETGTIRNIHYGDIHTKFKPLFRVRNEYVPYINPDASTSEFDDDAFCEEGDIVLADASEDLEDIGKAIEVVSLDGERVVAGTHTILATRRGRVPVVGFGGHLFQSAAVRAGIKKEAQGAKVYGISANRISAVQVPVPPTEAEQQKIADSLGSLDDLIEAEGRKLESLRKHKQGLVQRLLPQPGETRPWLRFPEFRNAPEWEEKKLGDVSDVLMCKRIFASETNPDEGVPFYKIGTLGGAPDAFISKDLYERYKSKYNFPRTGEILITCSGTVGKCLPYDGSDAYFQDSNIVWIDNPTLKVSNEFMLNILSSVNWSTLNSTTITRIYGPDLRGLAINFPQHKDEQERIATCLSSVDDLISAQAETLFALQTYKQGLLQQLFPSLEGR